MSVVAAPRASFFVFTGDERRVRRPRDVGAIVFGFLLVSWAATASDRIPDWAVSLTSLVEAGPNWVTVLLSLGYVMSLLYALVVTVALILGRRERRGAVRDVLIVIATTLGLVILLSFLVNRAWPYMLPEIDLQNPIPRFPVTRVALVTGILLVAGAYLTRPMRRFGWLAMLTTAFASVALGYASPIHAVGSFGVGLMTAGILLVIVGTPRGYPAPETVSSGLSALGLDSWSIQPADDQYWGLVRFEAIDDQGEPLDIKVYGRDAFDSQLAAKVWRTMLYREIGRTVSFSRLQAVEHEALVSLMAGRAGVSVPELRAVGNATSEIALIAFDGGGVSLDRMSPGDLTDRLLVSVWEQVGLMQAAGISHGRLRSSSIRVDDGEVMITDFGLGSVAPGVGDRAADVVELLFSTAVLTDAQRAVACAVEGLGIEALTDALPYLQVPALSATTRRQAKSPKELVAALTEEVIAATGATPPEPVEVRRVTVGNLVMLALLLLVAYAIIPLFTSVDYAAIWAEVQSADWALIVLATIVGHLQFFPQATATMFAVPVRLPFWPLMTLQTSSQFISLAIPSAAGRVAMNAAFLVKYGMTPAQAVSLGAIDGFSGFLVQAAIMLIILLTGNIDLNLDIDTGDVPWLLVLAIIAGLIVVSVVVILRVESLRKKVVPVVTQAWDALMSVLRDPSRAMGLLGSNFVYWVILGITLWILMGSLGTPIGFGEALFVTSGTSLLAGFMPVPGGVGVAEATMVALLVTIGVPQPVAFAATAVYRAITFYLPALEGMFGTRWLRANDYL